MNTVLIHALVFFTVAVCIFAAWVTRRVVRLIAVDLHRFVRAIHHRWERRRRPTVRSVCMTGHTEPASDFRQFLNSARP